jgi:hypothetical protein
MAIPMIEIIIKSAETIALGRITECWKRQSKKGINKKLWNRSSRTTTLEDTTLMIKAFLESLSFMSLTEVFTGIHTHTTNIPYRYTMIIMPVGDIARILM